MDGWYYAQNGQSVGPISQAELKQLVASGQVSGDDQVWHSSMASWTAAKKVPGLIVRAAPAAAAPQAFGQLQAAAEQLGSQAPQQQYAQPDAGNYAQQQGVLGYQGSNLGGELVVTTRAMGFLRQTRPWAMFMAVLLFISAGLYALMGIVALAGGSMFSGGRGGSGMASSFAAGMSMAHFVIAFIYFILGFYLVKFCGSIGRLHGSRQTTEFENAMQAQMSFWRLSGIIAIVAIVLVVVMVLLVFAMAAGR